MSAICAADFPPAPFLDDNNCSSDDLAMQEQGNVPQPNSEGTGLPEPILSLSSIELPDTLRQSLTDQGIVKPTSIQSQVWPVVFQGRDLVGIAETGSGKTLAYILPAVLLLLNRSEEEKSYGPSVLVLAPTRELALQIHQVADRLGSAGNLRSVPVYGGAPKGPQMRELSRGADLCIATPGRLLDLISNGTADISGCKFLVLDEADRMLDMGFEPQVRGIVEYAADPLRQTLMLSATWPKQVKRLAKDFLRDYVQICLGSGTANPSITQNILVCEETEKTNKLLELMNVIYQQQDYSLKTLIFAETKRKVEDLSRLLQSRYYLAAALHGDKTQHEREQIMADFSRGRRPVLVATDVAGRGLDVGDLRCVVNFDYPRCVDDYVHRIGRTGRNGQRGTAFTLFTARNSRHASDLVALLRDAKQAVDGKLLQLAERQSYRFNYDANYYYNNKY